MNHRRSLVAAGAVALILLGACGDDGASVRHGGSGSGSDSGEHGSGSGSGSASGAGACEPVSSTGATKVSVALDDYAVAPSPATVAAGRVVFEARNEGEHPHELIVVKAASPDQLPLVTSGTDKGRVDEQRLPAGSFVGEIEEFASGKTCSASFPLERGSYVLFCNVVETHGGETQNHFQRGMHTTFTVS